MRTHIAAVWTIAVSLVLVSNVMIADATAQPHTPALSFQDLTFQLSSPEGIARYMWRHFSIEKDQRQFGAKEYWQTPEEMLQNKKGDCEDFALFAQKMLKAAGFQAFLLNVYGQGFAHTVCVFRENGVFHIIDGTDIKRYGAKSIEELSEQIHPLWKESSIVVQSKEKKSGKILKTISRLEMEQKLATYA